MLTSNRKLLLQVDGAYMFILIETKPWAFKHLLVLKLWFPLVLTICVMILLEPCRKGGRDLTSIPSLGGGWQSRVTSSSIQSCDGTGW